MPAKVVRLVEKIERGLWMQMQVPRQEAGRMVHPRDPDGKMIG